MKTFKIEYDDIAFNRNGELKMVEGGEEEAQSIERILTANLREFVLDLDHGFDYSGMRDKTINESIVRLALIDAVSQDKRVKSAELVSFDEYKINRSAAIRFKITMKSGDVIESEVSL